MFMKNAYKLLNKAALFFHSPQAFWLTLPAKLSAAIAIFKIHSFYVIDIYAIILSFSSPEILR